MRGLPPGQARAQRDRDSGRLNHNAVQPGVLSVIQKKPGSILDSPSWFERSDVISEHFFLEKRGNEMKGWNLGGFDLLVQRTQSTHFQLHLTDY